VVYGPIARDLALRLKYGRKVMLARTMARYMTGLRERSCDEPVLAPVPLHRRRIWGRGFNQAALIADQLGRRWAMPVEHQLLKRAKATRSLKGLSHGQRQRAVAGAFLVPDHGKVKGRTVILVDDVLASGATSEACAKALRRAGARRIELISWARVVRPQRFVR
jgi:ComF family protein